MQCEFLVLWSSILHEWTDEALTVCIFLRVDKRELTDAFAFWFPRCRRPLKVAPLLRYGKYCGILYSGCLGEKPCDALDACCMVHDHCVDANDGIISQLPASFSQKRKDGTGEKQGEKELFFASPRRLHQMAKWAQRSHLTDHISNHWY